MIMIGPGTGLAPFRAFIEERRVTGARGSNWLFFGEQHRGSDFFYEAELRQHEGEGLIRLDLAFSRDQAAEDLRPAPNEGGGPRSLGVA